MPRKLSVFYENFADNGTLANGSWNSSLPRGNMQTEDIGVVAQTTNALPASTWFSINLQNLQQVGGIALGPTNVSRGATWRVQAYSDAGLTTVKYDSGDLPVLTESGIQSLMLEWEDDGFWLGIGNYVSRDILPIYIWHVIPDASFEAAASQYWKISIVDPGNADGYVRIGRLVMGRALTPSINYAYGDNNFGLTPATDMTETIGGRRDFWYRYSRRSLRVSYPSLPETEIFTNVFRMNLRVGTHKQVFVVPDPDDVVNGVRRSFLATFKAIPSIQQVSYGRGSTAFDLEEVL